MMKRNYFTANFLSQFRAAAFVFAVCAVNSAFARADTVFTATLNGGQAVPATVSQASGIGSAILNQSEDIVTVTISLNGLSNSSFIVRVHSPAERGSTAEKIFTFPTGVTTKNFSVTPSEAANLKAGLWYFNVTTPNFPSGEIRGQIEPLCAPPPVNLKAWYRGENDANDAAGANHGSLPNGASFPAGKVGKAFGFNGTNQFAALGDNFNSQTFTVSMWVKPAASQTVFAALIDNNASQTANWAVQKGSSASQYWYHDGGGDAFFDLTADEWQHLIIIRSVSGVKIYRNGALQSFANFNAPVNYNLQTLMLARAANSGDQGSNRYWNGQVDELMIFDRPLSDAEISNLYNSGAAGVCTDSTAIPLRKNGKIFFNRRVGTTNDQIYTINENGSNLTNFTNNSGSYYFAPALSPDGGKIAYARNRVIFISDSNGFNETPLLLNHLGEESFPRWSPDGSKIVFTIGGGDQSEIYSVNLDGTNLKRLTNNSIYDYSAQWSPDGSKIVFTSARGGSYNIYTMKPDGTEVTRLTNGQEDFEPAWSPDGKKILFSRSGDLYLMNSDGSNLVNFVNSPSFYEDESAWSPDGKKIVFVRDVPSTGRQIWIMNADGSGQTILVGDNLNGSPNWQWLPNNQNVNISLNGGINLTFSTIFSPGASVAAQLSAKGLPKLPDGYFTASPSYDLRTSVVFDNAQISFNLPSVADAATCEQMRVLHFIDGVWTDTNNAVPSFNSGVCTVSQFVSSLSPFVVARYNFGAQTYSISGTAVYGTTPAGQPAKLVSNVSLTAQGASYASENTELNGSYLLNDLIAGEQYIVSPSKTGNINGITSFDAVLVLRCVAAGNVCALNPNQRLAADTNGDNAISPFDATQILRFTAAAGQSNACGAVGNWRFTPASRSYAPLSDSQTDQNFEAILIGEVSGDWTPPLTNSLAESEQSMPFVSKTVSVNLAEETERRKPMKIF